MLTCQKHLFSLPEDVVYLNCAYMGPLPEAVELAGYEGVARKTLPFEITAADFFTGVALLKSLFARLIHTDDAERVAIIPSVSYGIANVVRNVKAQKGQNIVLVDEIFPSNYYPWKRLADETGAELRVVGAPKTATGRGAAWNEKIMEAIDCQTVAASVPMNHWADGTLFDLAAFRKRTRELGALMIVDGSQSVGALPFDVQELQPDALICVGYKWMLGPYGLGMAYYGSYFDDGAPIEENWMNRLESENFQALVNYQPMYKPKAHRYCVGENSQFVSVAMQTASLKMILDWGVENIQAYCRQLSAPYCEKFSALGCSVEGPAHRSGHLFGIRLPGGVDLEQLKKEAQAANVFVSFRGNAVRISPNVYNDEHDFEKLLLVLKSVLKS